MRGAFGYTVTTVAIATLVAVAGAALGAQASSVRLGATLAGGVQLMLFWSLVLPVARERRYLAYGVAALGRMLAVVAVALLLLPYSGAAAAPTLLAMVTVLFLTTLLEPMMVTTATLREAR